MASDHNYFVYIIECSDKSYYVGVTNDLELRIEQHNEGKNPKAYTYKRRPVEWRYYERFKDINQAIDWEKKLKGWNTIGTQNLNPRLNALVGQACFRPLATE